MHVLPIRNDISDSPVAQEPAVEEPAATAEKTPKPVSGKVSVSLDELLTALKSQLAPPLMLSVDDLAREFGLSRRGVQGLDAQGKLPMARKLGASKRWSRTELVEWIAAGCPCRAEWVARKAAANGGRR